MLENMVPSVQRVCVAIVVESVMLDFLALVPLKA